MRILQRYVLMDLLRVFSLLLLGLTIMLVFVGVIGEATKSGLGPAQIIRILPYIIPSLLPYTIPATLLLTVCVVYGRMSGDQEITATKAAGINVMAVLWPAFVLGAVLSLSTLLLTDQIIPWSRFNIQKIITLAMEDIFMEMLRTRNQVNDIDHGIAITVIGVDGKKLITPTFRYTPVGGNALTIQAQEATVKFDIVKLEAVLQLYRGHIETPGGGTTWFERETLTFPLPTQVEEPRARDITIQAIREELAGVAKKRNDLEHRQITTIAFALTEGDFDRLSIPEFQNYAPEMERLNARYNRLVTEIHSRIALACSSFFFIFLGSPFAILQARRQFLTNFMICFMPIILVYYPVVLLTMDLGKNDAINPAWGVWTGNVLLCAAGVVVLRKVLRH